MGANLAKLARPNNINPVHLTCRVTEISERKERERERGKDRQTYTERETYTEGDDFIACLFVIADDVDSQQRRRIRR